MSFIPQDNEGGPVRDVERIHEAFQAWTDLIDEHLSDYDPETDNAPVVDSQAHGQELEGTSYRATRFSLLEPPLEGSLPGPYCSMLSQAKVITFKTIEFTPGEARRLVVPKTSHVELIDPTKRKAATSLLSIMFRAGNPLPEAFAPNEHTPMVGLATPFADALLTSNLLHMAITLKRLSAEKKLARLSFADTQAMYSQPDS